MEKDEKREREKKKSGRGRGKSGRKGKTWNRWDKKQQMRLDRMQERGGYIVITVTVVIVKFTLWSCNERREIVHLQSVAYNQREGRREEKERREKWQYN